MRVVVAPDKFRGSLSAREAAHALAVGVRAADPVADVVEIPMADGGEGTAEALVAATGGAFHEVAVSGPLGDRVVARFGLLGDGRTAVLEMASASGLALIPADRRNPLIASTFGTGELFLAAVAAGARRVVIGIGGSATNDGGAGFARALGYQFLDADGLPVGEGGGALDRVARVDASRRDPRLTGVAVEVACDVDNPLCGPRGASAVYGPQKGADAETVARLDSNLAHFADVVERDLGLSVRDIPGAGAAGGLGAGLVAFASGRLEPGISLVIRTVGLAERLKGADICLTGEGAIDASSAYGKTAVGVARLARSLGVPTLALAGNLGPGAESVLAEGVDAVFSLCPGPVTLEAAVANATAWLARAAEQAVRAFLAGRRH